VQLGEHVNGLLMGPEWRFVTADAHDVHQAVNRHDANARLVGTPDGRIAVARFIERDKLDDDIEDALGQPVNDRGGAWLLVFYPKRDGEPMRGEPDTSVIEQLQQRDLWARRERVNERQILQEFEGLAEEEQVRAEARQREAMRARAEEILFGWAKANSHQWANRIFVPRGVNGAGHLH
jgi:hypothetical protein